MCKNYTSIIHYFSPVTAQKIFFSELPILNIVSMNMKQFFHADFQSREISGENSCAVHKNVCVQMEGSHRDFFLNLNEVAHKNKRRNLLIINRLSIKNPFSPFKTRSLFIVRLHCIFVINFLVNLKKKKKHLCNR